MALEATHIRFALNVKDQYRVRDMKRYLLGTVYPDSRYVTGIERSLTHPTDYPDWHWETADDFKKGWLVHLLADEFQSQIVKEQLPHVFEGETGQGSEVWIKNTAIKILQDINDVRKFDIGLYLPYLAFAENPNGEEVDKVNKYHQTIIKMYEKPRGVGINTCCEMWREFGIGDESVAKVKHAVEQYNHNESVMVIVHGIYRQMLNKTKHLTQV